MSATANALYLRRRIGNAVALLLSCVTALFGLFFLGFLLLLGFAWLVAGAVSHSEMLPALVAVSV